jgi:outer membrane receptor protein involved in Fe transport
VPNNNGSRIIAICVASILSASVAVAADAPAPDSAELGEVVVTANKLTATKVLDTPVSIQAISGDALQRSGASNIMDIAGEIPGLAIQDLGPGDKRYVIRGINSAGSATAGIYYGEAVISGANADDGGGFQADIRYYDLDRVEVLRGPQGTLYGASSMSGTIRFIPKSPDMHDVNGYINMEGSQTSHGSGNYNVNGAINLPIVDGVLALRMVGWKVYDSGYINQIRVGTGVPVAGSIGTDTKAGTGQTAAAVGNGVLKGINDDDVGGGRAILRYTPFEQLAIEASYTAQTERAGGSSRYTPAGVKAFSGGLLPDVNGCDLCNTDVTQSPWRDNIKVFGLKVDYDTGFGTVTGTTNQFNRHSDYNFDSTPILISFGLPIDAVPGETLEPRERKVNSSEIRFASKLPGPVNFVVGGYREHDFQDLNVQVLATNGFGLPAGPFCTSNACDYAVAPFGAGTTFFGRDDQRFNTEYAAFSEVTWNVTDALTAVGGIRYYTQSLSGIQQTTHPFNGFPSVPLDLNPPDIGAKFNKITWKENISYKFNDAALVYETVSTGFRAGGLNAVSNPFEPIPVGFGPDTLMNFELGLKGRLFGGLFDYQVDAYFIRWDNIQVQQTTPDNSFSFQGNAGQAHVKGFEYELTARPIQYLTVNFSGSFQDAKLSDVHADQLKNNPTLGAVGDPIPNVPRFQFAYGMNYTRPIYGDWEGMLAADVTYRDAINAYFVRNTTFNMKLPPYALVGLRAGVIKGPWSVTAFARNLTDKRAEVSAINSVQDPSALLTVQPRTVGLSLTRKF